MCLWIVSKAMLQNYRIVLWLFIFLHWMEINYSLQWTSNGELTYPAWPKYTQNLFNLPQLKWLNLQISILLDFVFLNLDAALQNFFIEFNRVIFTRIFNNILLRFFSLSPESSRFNSQIQPMIQLNHWKNMNCLIYRILPD